MSNLGNTINNNVLTALSTRAGQNTTHAIHEASAKTGVNFSYLMEQAAAESDFDVKAKANTSSASGLFQFIDKTWLNMVRDHGHKHGMGEYSHAINSKGYVADRTLRQEILDLRFDPEKSSAMAAELAAENKKFMERHLSGEVGSTELYFAHFMGAGTGTAFLKEREENPLSYGADLFPKEARTNRNVFYDPKTQKPRTLEDIYAFFDKKFSNEKFEIKEIADKSISVIPTQAVIHPSTCAMGEIDSRLRGNDSGNKNQYKSLSAISNRLTSDLSHWLLLSRFSAVSSQEQHDATDHS